MSFVENVVSRTTGFGIVAGLSIVPGLIIGIVFWISNGDPAALSLMIMGPISALLMGPLHPLWLLLARIPFSFWFLMPFWLSYLILVKPAAKFAEWKGWVEEIG